MVNKNIFLLFFIFIFSLGVYSQTKLTEKDSLSIIKVLDFQQSAWNDGNIDYKLIRNYAIENSWSRRARGMIDFIDSKS